MELVDYFRVLRQRWRTVIGCVLIALTVAAGYVVLAPKSYEAQAKEFVSVNATSRTDPANALYAGTQFALQRMKSYIQLSDSDQVLKPVISELGLNESTSALKAATSVVNPIGSVVLDVIATDSHPGLSARIANAMAHSLSSAIEKLEAGSSGATGFVKVDVTTNAQTPDSQTRPNRLLDLMLALLIGLAVGISAAAVRDRLELARLAAGPSPQRDRAESGGAKKRHWWKRFSRRPRKPARDQNPVIRPRLDNRLARPGRVTRPARPSRVNRPARVNAGPPAAGTARSSSASAVGVAAEPK